MKLFTINKTQLLWFALLPILQMKNYQSGLILIQPKEYFMESHLVSEILKESELELWIESVMIQ